jgi:uncharacterized protein (DUF302 family)
MHRVIHQPYVATRRELVLDVGYDEFTHALEAALGTMDFERAAKLRSTDEAAKLLASFVGASGFVLFQKIDHGGLLSLFTGRDVRASTYVFGNALIAIEMTRVEPRCGLYVPLRMFVESVGVRRVDVTYDVPSSLLDQFRSAEVTSVAETLDRKVEHMIDDAAKRAGAIAA